MSISYCSKLQLHHRVGTKTSTTTGILRFFSFWWYIISIQSFKLSFPKVNNFHEHNKHTCTPLILNINKTLSVCMLSIMLLIRFCGVYFIWKFGEQFRHFLSTAYAYVLLVKCGRDPRYKETYRKNKVNIQQIVSVRT